MTVESIKAELEKRLKPQRYAHSLGVAETARELAKIYGADEDKAYLAGILHDCAKNYTSDELYEKSARYGIVLDEISQKSPPLVHAYVGAEEARRIYGVCDDEVYDAIYRHTTGGANMALLTKIIYLADGIEPHRQYDGVEKIRQTARENIDRAVVMYTDSTITYVIKQGQLLHTGAVDTRNFYLGK